MQLPDDYDSGNELSVCYRSWVSAAYGLLRGRLLPKNPSRSISFQNLTSKAFVTQDGEQTIAFHYRGGAYDRKCFLPVIFA